jgi:ketosteroid isomerase-like protein
MKRVTAARLLRLILPCLLCTAVSHSLAQNRSAKAHAERQTPSDETLIRKFFQLREQLLDQRGTSAKVDELLSLFAHDGHYEHPAASVTMTTDEARNGMLAHLREGRDATMTIKRILHGSNFLVAETTLRYSMPDEAGTMKSIERNGVAIFEMKGDQIVRVAEY